MSLTVNDIQSKQFHVRFRGFDMEEVDSFLELIAEHFAMLVEDNKKLTSALEESESELGKFKGQEKYFKSAIVSAQKIADEMAITSREKADAIISEARQEAGGIISEARQEANHIKEDSIKELDDMDNQIAVLIGMKQDVKNEFIAVLEKYHNILDDDSLIVSVQSNEAKNTINRQDDNIFAHAVENTDNNLVQEEEQKLAQTVENEYDKIVQEEEDGLAQTVENETDKPVLGEDDFFIPATEVEEDSPEQEKDVFEKFDIFEEQELKIDDDISFEEKREDAETTEEDTQPKLIDQQPDLSDLYEKIDFGDGLTSDKIDKLFHDDGMSDRMSVGSTNEGLARQSENTKETTNIPDLDSDIIFTLDDPLDEDDDNYVDVSINNK